MMIFFGSEDTSAFTMIASQENEELINALDQNALDLIITYGNNSNVSSNYKNELLLSDEYVFIYNENKLKIDNIESIKDLNNYNLILPSKETIERKKLDDKLNGEKRDKESYEKYMLSIKEFLSCISYNSYNIAEDGTIEFYITLD